MLSRRTTSTSLPPPPRTPEAKQPPSDPLPDPSSGSSRPSDVVVNRLHELKRITKSLAAYFEGVASAHNVHSTTLSKLSTSLLPLHESSIFLPTSNTSLTSKHASLNSSAAATPATSPGIPRETGWAELLVQIKENNKSVAEEHGEMAKDVGKKVVLPLKKLRIDIKAHIASMEKEITKLADAVTKEREVSQLHFTSINKSLTTLTTPMPATPVSTSYFPSLSSSAPAQPTILPPHEDPVLQRYGLEKHLESMVSKENELRKLVWHWQEKSEALEKDVLGKVGEVWKVWEGINTNLLLSNQQRSVLLSASVDSVPPDSEWNYFSKLNHLLPATLGMKDVSEVDWKDREDERTFSVREGLLERQKRFVKSWKSGFFILTPTGYLHEYATPDAPTNKPAASLYLPSCLLGPMPTPEPSVKGKQLEALFTIEGEGGVRNVFRARSWEELSEWWKAIEQYTKPTPVSPKSPTDETTFASVGGANGDLGDRMGEEGHDEDEDAPPAISKDEDAPLHSRPVPPIPSSRPVPPIPQEEDVTSPTIHAKDGDSDDHPSSVALPPTPPMRLPPTPPPEPHSSDIGTPERAGDIALPTPLSPPILTERPESPSASPDVSKKAEHVEHDDEMGDGDLGTAL